MNENDTKPMQNSDEIELKQNLSRLESGNNEQKPTENVVNADIPKPFVCPDFVLNFLQDKPIKLQKIILTAKLTQGQKKEVEHIFLPNENELAINREALKALISKLAEKYPEVRPYLTNEAVFFGTFTFGLYDRSEQIKAILESKGDNVTRI